MFGDLTGMLWFFTVGLLAGWLAGEIKKGEGLGLMGNAFIGIAGAYLGAFVFRYLDISISGMIGSVVTALVGATILLFVVVNLGSLRT